MATGGGRSAVTRARAPARPGRGAPRRRRRRPAAVQPRPGSDSRRRSLLGGRGRLPAGRRRGWPPAQPPPLAGRGGARRRSRPGLLRRPQRQRRGTHPVGSGGADRRLPAARHLLQPEPPRGLPRDRPGADLRLGLVGDAAGTRPAGTRPAGAVARSAGARLADPVRRAHLHRLAWWDVGGVGRHRRPGRAAGHGAAPLGAGDAGGGGRHRRDRGGARHGAAGGAGADARHHAVRRQPGSAASGVVGDAGPLEELPDHRHRPWYLPRRLHPGAARQPRRHLVARPQRSARAAGDHRAGRSAAARRRARRAGAAIDRGAARRSAVGGPRGGARRAGRPGRGRRSRVLRLRPHHPGQRPYPGRAGRRRVVSADRCRSRRRWPRYRPRTHRGPRGPGERRPEARRRRRRYRSRAGGGPARLAWEARPPSRR